MSPIGVSKRLKNNFVMLKFHEDKISLCSMGVIFKLQNFHFTRMKLRALKCNIFILLGKYDYIQILLTSGKNFIHFSLKIRFLTYTHKILRVKSIFIKNIKPPIGR